MESINETFAVMNAHVIHKRMPKESDWRKRGVLWIDAHLIPCLSVPGRRTGPYASLQNDLAAKLRIIVFQKDLKKKRTMTLRVLLGSSRYMTTENINLQCGIANGMLVSIVDVRLKPKAAPVWGKAKKAHRVNACEVDCLVPRFHSKDWVHKKLYNSLAPGMLLLGLRSTRTHTVRPGYL